MGRGDKKTKKGKIFKGSFGVSRSARTAKPVVGSKAAATAIPKEKPVKKAAKKTAK